MRARVLLNLLNKFEKRQNVRFASIFLFFHNKFNKYSSTNVRFYLTYDPKTTLKLILLLENAQILQYIHKLY